MINDHALVHSSVDNTVAKKICYMEECLYRSSCVMRQMHGLLHLANDRPIAQLLLINV